VWHLPSGAYSGRNLEMRNKFRLFLGWFGVLTPVYAAGALTALLATGEVQSTFVGQMMIVSTINFFIGRKLLKTMVVKKKRG